MRKRQGFAKGIFGIADDHNALDEQVSSHFPESVETAEGENRAVRNSDAVVCEVGAHLRELRLYRNVSQEELADKAGISISTLRKLESGSGGSLRTLVCVLAALGRLEWLNTLAPVPTVNPLSLTKRNAQTRQRASRSRKTYQAAKEDA